jgi:hypothetical protein
MARSKKLVEDVEDKVDDVVETVEDQIDETAAADTLHPGAMPVGAANKSTAIGMVVNALAGMDQETINNFLASILQIGHEADSIPDDAAKKNKATVDAKPSNAGVQLVTKLDWANEEVETRISDIIKEDVSALFEGEEISEEFKAKVSTILESTINLKVDQAVVAIEEAFEKRYDEEIEEITESLIDTFDGYLSYAVNEWVEQNRVAIESTLKSDLTEEFIEGLKALFNTHYITVPEDRVDVVAEMDARIEELEMEASRRIDEVQELRRAVAERDAEIVVTEATRGMTESDAERLRELSETVEFGSAEELRSKVDVLKETYFGAAEGTPVKKAATLFEEVEVITDDETPSNLSKSMSAYVNTIGRTVRK